MSASRLAICIALLLVVACESETATEPLSGSRAAVVEGPDVWSCYDPEDPHCLHDPPIGDLDPTAPGVFLGMYNPAYCFDGGGNDADQDALTDFCEYQLALSFRPILVTSPYDLGLSRQSYWAATRWANQSAAGVALIYLLAYNVDWGNSFDPACQSPANVWCGGHFGDSEFIVIYVTFNRETLHWELYQMYTAAHWGESELVDSSRMSDWWELAWGTDSKSRWFPKVWVARDKHGSFRSVSTCNSGALGTDDCSDSSEAARVDVIESRNVGSGSFPMVGTVSSIRPLLYQGTENLWAYQPFCGWDGNSLPSRNNCSSAYAAILDTFGFSGT